MEKTKEASIPMGTSCYLDNGEKGKIIEVDFGLFSPYTINHNKEFIRPFLNCTPDIQVLRFYEDSHPDFSEIILVSDETWRIIDVGTFYQKGFCGHL
ncbi:unnamed protein product [Lupinus luteus]|uniref:Uncharacterized protein n=1 Tax=Lupinus luteus TaxID=3873 RepID=A0AAV1W1K6_LUPLU